MHRIVLPERPRILVVALRRLGDVLLTTPLIRSVRRAWPDATIDALVFAGTAGVLEGNPDLDRVVTMPVRPTARETLALAAKLWKRYALAVTTQSGDRPTMFALAAGRAHVGPVEARLSGTVKRQMLRRSVPVAAGVHRVEEMLRLVDALGIARVPELVCPESAATAVPDTPYAVIHAAPMFRYKRWTREGWRELAAALRKRGLAIMATGGPDETERKYLDELWQDDPSVRRLDGRVAWPELAGEGVHRARHVGYASRRRQRLPDHRALRTDGSAALGTLADRRTARYVARRGPDATARQCLAGAESAAVPAVPEGRLRPSYRKLQPLPR
jgi:heptosyltransferase-3